MLRQATQPLNCLWEIGEMQASTSKDNLWVKGKLLMRVSHFRIRSNGRAQFACCADACASLDSGAQRIASIQIQPGSRHTEAE